MAEKHNKQKAEFAQLRQAYILLSDIIAARGRVSVDRGGKVSLHNLGAGERSDFSTRLAPLKERVAELVTGVSARKSSGSDQQVVLACMSAQGGGIEVAALLVRGRSRIEDALFFTLAESGWQDSLARFAPWEDLDGVIAAADGNNQRSVVGLVLSMAGIGQGRLAILEVDNPEEIDESAHLVRGAEWMKAGLPRFHSAASEALWYLMRIRSMHSRKIKTVKQGLYTSMAISLLAASGVSQDQGAERLGMSEGLYEKLGRARPGKVFPRDLEFIAKHIDPGCEEDDAQDHAIRIYKGAGIFLRSMDWKIASSRKARAELAEGADLVEVAEHLGLERRELVRILSASLDESRQERERFLAGIVRPSDVRAALS